MVLALSGVTAIFYTHTHQAALVWLLMVFIIFFAISQGSVIWVYIAEVFPNRVRSKGQSIGSSSHWISAALITLYFPVVVAKFSQWTPFAFFAAMMAVQFFVVLFVFPETKGRTLEQIQARFGIH
jgi:MFS family permease